jgi:hypothetical protein
MNEYAQDGWEYQRAESLPDEEKKGLMGGREVVTRNILVFRRELYFEEIALKRARPGPSPQQRPSPCPAAPTPKTRAHRKRPAAGDMDEIYAGRAGSRPEPAPTRRPLVADRKGQGVDF